MDLLEQFRDLRLACEVTPNSVRLGTLRITSELLGDIKEGQKTNPFLRTQLEAIELGRDNSFNVGSDGVLRLQGLPRTPRGLDSIWVIVDRLTKYAHFVPINIRFSLEKLTSLYISEIEALYGRRCRTPLCWLKPGEGLTLGPEVVQQTTEKVKLIQERMRTAQSKQKSYQDKRRKDLAFEVGDHVFLRVTLWTGVGRALKSRKLTPRFIGPFQILKRVGPVAYQISLPPSLSNLHNVFHVSQLRKYIHDPSHVVELDDVQVKENLTYETLPLRIEDR
ncbi:uncharacterized protein [Glycine max]|uniref:uncharacterized protein n=1 Tax=Glycine max TaxID=3847 RepID=UPI0003DED4B0|nr:uncharacterized protein LOC102659625 [Glycine max]|eukprot:XP_006589980.1 uncharacterized protein LOC102659625 [Glycine max]